MRRRALDQVPEAPEEKGQEVKTPHTCPKCESIKVAEDNRWARYACGCVFEVKLVNVKSKASKRRIKP